MKKAIFVIILVVLCAISFFQGRSMERKRLELVSIKSHIGLISASLKNPPVYETMTKGLLKEFESRSYDDKDREIILSEVRELQKLLSKEEKPSNEADQ